MRSTEDTIHEEAAPEQTECGPGFAQRAMKAVGFTLLGAAVAIPAICLYLGRRALTQTRSSMSRSPRDVTTRPEPAAPIRITVATEEPQPPRSEPADRVLAEAPPAEPEPPYVASTQSDKFHVPSCRWAKQIQMDHRLTFADREDAISGGYVPCGTCNP